MELSSYTAQPCYCQRDGANRSFSASETRMAAISESQSLDMNLVTKEGDVVTLSYDAYTAAFYAEHGEVDARDDDLAVQWAELSAGKYERELSFSVEGDLNAQERRDIRKAIKTIGRMMKNFVQGRVRPMMAKAGKLSGLETIANLDVDMAYERQVVTARQTEMAVAYDQRGDALNRPAPFVSAPETLQTETRPLVHKMADVARAVPARSEDMLRMIERMLDWHRKELGQMDTLVADLFDHIKEEFKALLMADEAFQAA